MLTWDSGVVQLRSRGDGDGQEEEAEQGLNEAVLGEYGAHAKEEEERGCGASNPIEAELGVLDGQHNGEDAEVSKGDAY